MGLAGQVSIYVDIVIFELRKDDDLEKINDIVYMMRKFFSV